MSLPAELSAGQFQLVYNMFSLTLAAMLASFAYFVMVQQQLTAKYRPALILSSLVVGIAAYHYWRIFESWDAAYAVTEAGTYAATGQPFNDAYRYVDWLLTVPLLVAELVSVLALPAPRRGSLMARLVIASALMIGLGYPGEVAATSGERVLWAVLSTVPFVYILAVLFGELGAAADAKDERVRILLRNTRLLLIATWGFYPIAYALPLLGVSGDLATIGVQVGYSIADITAKCGYGILIYAIARAKMDAEGVELAVVRDGARAAR
jgi:bacteriorhodopsin